MRYLPVGRLSNSQDHLACLDQSGRRLTRSELQFGDGLVGNNCRDHVAACQTDGDLAVDRAFGQLGNLTGELIPYAEAIISSVGNQCHRGSLNKSCGPFASCQTKSLGAIAGYYGNQLIASRDVNDDLCAD